MNDAHRRWPRYAAPALVVVTVLLALGWSSAGRDSEPSMPLAPVVATPAQATPAQPARWQALGRSQQFVTGLEHLPASLDGTEVPDGLQVDSQGNLIITLQLRDLFDYFLSSLGEEDLDTLVARLRAYFADNLPAAAALQANRTLEGYLAWRDNLASIEEVGGVPASQLDLQAVRLQQAEVQASCSRFLDDVACEAFFAQQNISDNYGIERLAVLQDDNLDATEKARRLASLQAALPAPIQQQISDVSRYQELQLLTQSMQQQGGNSADLRTVREQIVGAEAADRLEQLDRERAQFAQRVEQWMRERAQLLNNGGLSSADLALQIDTLRAQRFSAEALARVQTLERIADAGE